MKELVASFLYSALRNLFRNQPDLSTFTHETHQHEPNLSFHFANELWPYLFWLQCDFDVTKHNLGERRPDIVFHRRGVHALNFLVVEVKRRQNPEGVEKDIHKIHRYWFPKLRYRFATSVLIDEQTGKFEIQLFENVPGDKPLQITLESRHFERPVFRATPQHHAELGFLVAQIDKAERARKETGELRLKLDQLVCGLYE